jgi:hypothetical protein
MRGPTRNSAGRLSRLLGSVLVLTSLLVGMLPLVAFADDEVVKPDNNGECWAGYEKISPPDDRIIDPMTFKADRYYESVVLVGGPPNENNQDPDGRDKEFKDVIPGQEISREFHEISHICVKPNDQPEPRYVCENGEVVAVQPDDSRYEDGYASYDEAEADCTPAEEPEPEPDPDKPKHKKHRYVCVDGEVIKVGPKDPRYKGAHKSYWKAKKDCTPAEEPEARYVCEAGEVVEVGPDDPRYDDAYASYDEAEADCTPAEEPDPEPEPEPEPETRYVCDDGEVIGVDDTDPRYDEGYPSEDEAAVDCATDEEDLPNKWVCVGPSEVAEIGPDDPRYDEAYDTAAEALLDEDCEEVLPPVVTTTPGDEVDDEELPFTGMDSGVFAAIAAVLLLAGISLLGFSRRVGEES